MPVDKAVASFSTCRAFFMEILLHLVKFICCVWCCHLQVFSVSNATPCVIPNSDSLPADYISFSTTVQGFTSKITVHVYMVKKAGQASQCRMSRDATWSLLLAKFDDHGAHALLSRTYHPLIELRTCYPLLPMPHWQINTRYNKKESSNIQIMCIVIVDD